MNAIFVLNINDKMFQNSRDSIKEACYRWGCNYFELNDNLVGDQDVCFNKIVGIKKYWIESNVDGILYLDSDILIRNDAPNPFELFSDSTKVYAVKDCFNGWSDEETLSNYRIDVSDAWLREVHNILKYDVDIDEIVTSCPSWFFNAGVFLLRPENVMEEIDIFIDNIPKNRVAGRIEQAMWNYILHVKNRVELIDYTWNSLNRDVSDGIMHSYIYHFTGFNWQPLKKALPIYKWNYTSY